MPHVLVALVMAVQAQAQSPPRVPLVEGLTIVTAGQWAEGDYESLKRITEVGDSGIRFEYSGRTPGQEPDEGKFSVVRRVRRTDLQEARRYKISFSPLDEELAPGTTGLGISTAVLDELKRGSTVTFWVINEGGGGSLADLADLLSTGPDYRGTLTRVEPTAVPVPVLLNGERVMLSAIHARGRFGQGDRTHDGEFWFLDDNENPLALRFVFGSGSLRVVGIDLPPGRQIEQALQKRDTAVAYGLYFEFARADLRPESQPVLEEIAEMMRRHPTWSLQVAGHTDSIGGAASNLALSRRRAAAVVTALGRLGVAPERLAAAGYGSAAPREPNATLEGRARNRRVELTRLH